MHVLERLPHAAFRREIAGDHFRAFGVHDLRLGRRRARDFKKRRRVEAEAGGEDQSFGEREAIQAEDEIDGEFGPAAVADLADVKPPREQRIEHRRRVCRDALIAADEADAVALAHLLAGARHRHFEKAQALRDPRAERRDAVRIAGAGADHDLAGRRGQQRALDDVLDLIGREYREHDRIAVARDVGKRCRRGRRFARGVRSSPHRCRSRRRKIPPR